MYFLLKQYTYPRLSLCASFPRRPYSSPRAPRLTNARPGSDKRTVAGRQCAVFFDNGERHALTVPNGEMVGESGSARCSSPALVVPKKWTAEEDSVSVTKCVAPSFVSFPCFVSTRSIYGMSILCKSYLREGFVHTWKCCAFDRNVFPLVSHSRETIQRGDTQRAALLPVAFVCGGTRKSNLLEVNNFNVPPPRLPHGEGFPTAKKRIS